MQAAGFLGADSKGATPDDAGEVVAGRLVELMKNTGAPNGLKGSGFKENDTQRLAASAFRQKRAIDNAPRESNLTDIENIFSAAKTYW